MLILKIAILAFISTVLYLILKKEQPAYGFLVCAAGVLCLVGTCIGQLRPVLYWLKTLAAYAQGQNISVLLRVLGIALVAQLAADFCRDAGATAAAGTVELCGRALALYEALPLAKSLINSFLSFLS